MRDATGIETLVLDDLEIGHWYRIRVPLGCCFEAEWLGYDGHHGLLREEGSIRAEPWPCNLLAQCEITPMPAPVEIVEPATVPQSDVAVLRQTWPIVLGCSAVWAAGILYVVWRLWR